MALFKSQVLTQASGSVGGLTYTRTPSGMVIRARSMPVNPRTGLQTQIRAIMSELATIWSETLTQDQRNLWSQYAANVPVKNRLGDSIRLSGISMFLRCNSARRNAGLPAVLAAPTTFTTGEAIKNGVVQETLVPGGGTQFSWAAVPLPGQVLIQVSNPQNQSINFFKGPYRLNVTAMMATQEVMLVPDPSWVPGQRLFLRARISYSDGRLSPATEYQYDIPEPAPEPPEDLAAARKPTSKKTEA